MRRVRRKQQTEEGCVSLPDLPPYEWIGTAESWASCLTVLRKASRLAIDIESNSLHAYREEVCLIQISAEGHDYIIDPLAGLQLEPLGKILANRKVEKVFHACEYDMILLKRQYDWDAHHVFDTMWAARILGYAHMGLAWFLQTFYEVQQLKRFQKTDWRRRPLTADQLVYAQADTHYLLRLRDDLEGLLKEKGRFEEALEIFGEVEHVRVPDRDFDPDGFWYIRGARDLPPHGLAILRELYLWRDSEAHRRDRPPFKIIGNEALLRLAAAQPTTAEALRKLEGFPQTLAARYETKLLDAVATGLKASPPRPPTAPSRQPQNVLERYERLQQWRKSRARARGVESDVILSRDSMWVIAQRNPRTMEDLAGLAALGPHRLKMYGEAILAELGA